MAPLFSCKMILVLGYTISLVLITKLRCFLKDSDQFTNAWNVLSSASIGLCFGAIADIMIIPDNLAIFVLTFIFTTIIFLEKVER